ncbi:MAG: nitroreductase [Magnetococcales bacterium]|nr:nitroreductase [Magnetococcales bacterium]HIJ82970.1 nitroreductase family protein [Magnetococcales bacterium]
MNVGEAIERRRAVKKFDPGHSMTEAEVMELLRLTVLSPTAFNMQNWRFLWLRDPTLRREMRAIFRGKSQVTDAALLIMVLADLKAWEKSPQRYWKNASEEIRNRSVAAMDQFYRGHDQCQRDEAMRSGGLAAQTLMLAAQGMGWDSCPMIGFDFAAAARLIRLPEDHCIVMAVAIGKGLEPAAPRGGPLPLREVVVTDRFS